MQSRLNEIYMNLCKNYVLSKKENVRTMKEKLMEKMNGLIEGYKKYNALALIENNIISVKSRVMDYDNKKRNQSYNLTEYERQDADYQLEQYQKMNDIRKILNMSKQDLYKHEFLKYRINRLQELSEWFKELCI